MQAEVSEAGDFFAAGFAAVGEGGLVLRLILRLILSVNLGLILTVSLNF